MEGRKIIKIKLNKYLLFCTTDRWFETNKRQDCSSPCLTFIFHQQNNDSNMMAHKCTLDTSNVFLFKYLTNASSAIAPFTYSLNFGQHSFIFRSFQLKETLKCLPLLSSTEQTIMAKPQDVNASLKSNNTKSSL